MRETRESLALGMREAEVMQLRAVARDLRNVIVKKVHQVLMYENALKKIADMNIKQPLASTVADEVLGDFKDA